MKDNIQSSILDDKSHRIYTMKFSERLILAREHSGFSKSELARACGISKQAIGQMESESTKQPTPENLFKIAKATGVNPEWLATGKGKMLISSQEMVSEPASFYRYGPDIADNFKDAVEHPFVNAAIKGVPMLTKREVTEDKFLEDLDVKNHKKWVYSEAGVSDKAFAYYVQAFSIGLSNISFPEPHMALLIIDPENNPIHGSLVLVQGPDEVLMVKQYYIDGPNMYLNSLTQHLLPIKMNDEYKIKGSVVSITFSTRDLYKLN